ERGWVYFCLARLSEREYRSRAPISGCPSAGGVTLPVRISLAVKFLPYSSLFPSSSFRSVAPCRDTPANRPFEREYDRISAFMRASVSADADRPTGPAATEAFPPNVNLLFKRLSIPRSFIISITTSVDEPPSWNPTLPPSTCTAAGAPQPRPEFRHTA